MNTFIHGTSLDKALKLIVNPVVNEQNQEKLYFFDTTRVEAYAGALSFATGDGLRSINDSFNLNFVNDYVRLNPNFPKGLAGNILKVILKKSVKGWKNKQEKLKTAEYDNVACIVECEYFDEVVSINRQNIVFESFVSKEHFDKVKVQAIYIDSKHFEEVKIFLKNLNSSVEVRKIETLIEKL